MYFGIKQELKKHRFLVYFKTTTYICVQNYNNTLKAAQRQYYFNNFLLYRQ
jgi:hypothetical protein